MYGVGMWLEKLRAHWVGGGRVGLLARRGEIQSVCEKSGCVALTESGIWVLGSDGASSGLELGAWGSEDCLQL